MRLSLVGLGLAGLALLGCGRTTSAPVQIDAIVWFAQAVDTVLLRNAGFVVIGILWAPPTAYVRGSTEAIDRLRQMPQVESAWPLGSSADSVKLYVTFRDRPLRTDSLSDADRQLISSLGGRILYVFTLTQHVVVKVPASALAPLQASPLVASVHPIGPATRITD